MNTVVLPSRSSLHSTRRAFLGRAASGAGLLILPSGLRAGPGAPSNKVNVALIGVAGRGRHFPDPLAKENLVALCDVNEAALAPLRERFPRAKTYVDWRKCLEQKDLDAVVICTADHTHAFISNWAMNRDLHVYCEKPLAITVEEVRQLRSHWLRKRHKLATQVGTSIGSNHNRIRELVRDGAVGGLSHVHGWGTRKIRRQGYWPAAGTPPPGFHYDLWLGPSPHHPYHPYYFKPGNFVPPGLPPPLKAAGAVCLSWNMFWDFGTGQLGDMGSHTMNLIWNAVGATLPTAITARGEPYNPEVTPVELECHFEHPANDWRGPLTISWYQGGIMPRSPLPYVAFGKISDGALFKGSQGFLVGAYSGSSRLLIPFGDKADLNYYRPRAREAQIPTHGALSRWLEACRDPALNTTCDFEYGGNMMEQNLLGLVAYRAGRKIHYDGAAGRVTDYPAANEFLRKEYRKGWTIDG